jgi:histidinol dehydrogenase
MTTFLSASETTFDAALDELLARRAGEGTSVGETVGAILSEVRRRGDAALIDYTAQFDKLSLTAQTLRFSEQERVAIEAECPADVREALSLAAARIRAFHARQKPQDIDYVDDIGVRLGMRWSAVDAVGMYVPGGRAAYPSSVLMNAIPAQVAGVRRLVMVVPTPGGEVNPAILVAARLAGVHEIYRIGGAQAVAALAYGTETIAPVQLIVGPGNAYVAEAKRRVFGKVGIDMIAGPSEILVVADRETPAAWVAADLLSQAEHDPDAQSILITDDHAHAEAVMDAVAKALETLPKRQIAEASWRDYGGVIVVQEMYSERTAAIINRIAPEHLELAVADPQRLLPMIRHAGAIFLGRHTPEAIGDYIAGPSHVLPTMQTAAFSSGLSVYSFMKKSSLIGCSPEAFTALAAPTALLADTEGLGAHALSVRVRSSL